MQEGLGSQREQPEFYTRAFAKYSFLNNCFFKSLLEILAEFFVVNLEISKFLCTSWTFCCGLCTKGFRNPFRNPQPLWDPINSCSVNAFLCKLYYFEFLEEFVRLELLGLVWFVFKSLQPSEICPGCWLYFIFWFGLQIFADSSSASLTPSFR